MIKLGMVGYGYWGPNVARNFAEAKGCRITALCENDAARLKLFAQKFPDSGATNDYRDLLGMDVDAVAIVTPARTHYELAKFFLEAGKHVFVEKPLALSSREAEKLAGLAKARKRVLLVGHTFEYNPAVRWAKQYVQKGLLGEVYAFSFKRVNLGQVRRDVNVIWNLAPHDISILLYIKEEMPLRVRALGGSFLQKGVEDFAFLHFEFRDGSVAHMELSWLNPQKIREMTVIGSKKMIVFDDLSNEGKIRVFDKGVRVVPPEAAYGAYQFKLHSGPIETPVLDMREPLKIECEHFIECVEKKLSPCTDGQNGLRVVRVLEALEKSLKQKGAAVPVAGRF